MRSLIAPGPERGPLNKARGRSEDVDQAFLARLSGIHPQTPKGPGRSRDNSDPARPFFHAANYIERWDSSKAASLQA